MVSSIDQQTDCRQRFSIREAVEADIPAIREVARISWEATYAESLPEQTRAAFIRHSYSDSALTNSLFRAGRDEWFWVVENLTNNSLVGFAEVVLRNGFPPDAELTRIYLLPEWQAKGIGSALLEVIIETLLLLEEDLKPPRLKLTVHVDNAPAIRFYERRGFRLSREFAVTLPDAYFDPDPLWIKEYILELE